MAYKTNCIWPLDIGNCDVHIEAEVEEEKKIIKTIIGTDIREAEG